MLTILFGLDSYLSLVIDVLLALHGAALIVVNATPSPKDNEALAYFYRGVELVAGIVRKERANPTPAGSPESHRDDAPEKPVVSTGSGTEDPPRTR